VVTAAQQGKLAAFSIHKQFTTAGIVQ